MDIKHCFDMSGNLLFDAFRTDRNDPRYIAVFDEYGNLNDENNTENKLRKLVKNCMPVVPVLYDGIWDASTIKSLYDEKNDKDVHEGYVVRLADSFEYRDFKTSVAKFVRANHVSSQKHWFYGSNNHELNTMLV
jgi:hypothetical protein